MLQPFHQKTWKVLFLIRVFWLRPHAVLATSLLKNSRPNLSLMITLLVTKSALTPITKVCALASPFMRMRQRTNTSWSWCSMTCGLPGSDPFLTKRNQFGTHMNTHLKLKNTSCGLSKDLRICKTGSPIRFWRGGLELMMPLSLPWPSHRAFHPMLMMNLVNSWQEHCLSSCASCLCRLFTEQLIVL